MRKKTVAMTMVNGEIVDNYEDRFNYGVSQIYKAAVAYRNMQLMEDAMVIYHLIRAPEMSAQTLNLGEVDDVTYFKNKMLQGMGIPKDLFPCS